MDWSHLILTTFVALAVSVLSLIYFTYVYLETRKRAKNLDPHLKGFDQMVSNRINTLEDRIKLYQLTLIFLSIAICILEEFEIKNSMQTIALTLPVFVLADPMSVRLTRYWEKIHKKKQKVTS